VVGTQTIAEEDLLDTLDACRVVLPRLEEAGTWKDNRNMRHLGIEHPLLPEVVLLQVVAVVLVHPR
jgi:hypothetical protein